MKLTSRQEDVIDLVANGFADKEIAQKLKLSPRTVQTHLKTVILKLNARNRAHAAAIYVIAKYKS